MSIISALTQQEEEDNSDSCWFQKRPADDAFANEWMNEANEWMNEAKEDE